ncbi:hypothetical protein LGQ02_05640 [Bacillus shivajii]|uniref:hypothetical protein n=1 Tax=Bacillus shivajii TaxID=1983719 RepID=UPI001CFAD252|nr:hypothetical protein [Bacillus shivajii]UCZ54245.1 hypothetical protein LGQ02_05640 [Bacillus shivajii]
MMRKYAIRSSLVGSAFILLLSACANGDDNGGLSADEIQDEFEDQKESLEEQISELEQELEDRDLTIEDLRGQLDELGNDNGEHNGEETVDEREQPSLYDEGFYEQHWMVYEPSESAEEMGYEPETLDWREYEGSEPAGFSEDDSEYNDPGLLVHSWIAEAGYAEMMDRQDETTVRIRYSEDGESAEAIIFNWGLRDDSVRGEDYLLHLEETEGTWYIDEIETRVHCGRGVEGDLCL